MVSITSRRSPPKTAESHTRRKNIIEVTKVQCTFDIIDYYAYLTSLSDFAVNPVLGGDLHGVIDTIFLYYVLWHGEKSRGLEFKARMDMRDEPPRRVSDKTKICTELYGPPNTTDVVQNSNFVQI